MKNEILPCRFAPQVYWRVEDKNIYISKSVNPDFLNKVGTFHALAHAKIFELLGKRIRDMVSKDKVKAIIAYEEFVTDVFTKSKVRNYDLKLLFEWENKVESFERWDNKEYDELARIRATSLKFGMKDEVKSIDKALNGKHNVNAIKSLSEEFVKNSDFLTKTSEEQVEIVNKIAKKTLDLLRGDINEK